MNALTIWRTNITKNAFFSTLEKNRTKKLGYKKFIQLSHCRCVAAAALSSIVMFALHFVCSRVPLYIHRVACAVHTSNASCTCVSFSLLQCLARLCVCSCAAVQFLCIPYVYICLCMRLYSIHIYLASHELTTLWANIQPWTIAIAMLTSTR